MFQNIQAVPLYLDRYKMIRKVFEIFTLLLAAILSLRDQSERAFDKYKYHM